MANSPVLARRTLGAELRRLREDAKITAARAADELDCSISKISRIETGVTAPRRPEIDVLLRLYGGGALVHRDGLVELAGEGKRDAWYDEYGDLLAPGSALHRYIGLEEAATQVRHYACQWLPGLLQTEEFARSVLTVTGVGRTPEETERLVKVRMLRQDVLDRRPEPLRVAALLDESVIRRPASGSGVMHRQLTHLCSLVEKDSPNVEIRLLPFSLGLHGLLGAEFAILGLDRGEDDDVMFIEGQDGSIFQEKADVVRQHGDRWDAAWKASIEGRELHTFLLEAARTFE